MYKLLHYFTSEVELAVAVAVALAVANIDSNDVCLNRLAFCSIITIYNAVDQTIDNIKLISPTLLHHHSVR
jgi:hypothetical protein